LRQPEFPDEEPADARRGRRGRSGRLTLPGNDRRRRFAYLALGLTALALLLALPPVQTLLKQSFTRLPQPYASVYFTSSPVIDGGQLQVPVTVKGVDTGQNTYGLHVWTVDAAGKIDRQATAKITTANGVSAKVISMHLAPDATVVWVSLDGTQQTIHYRISKT
jgi:hypothetical protein